MILGEKMFVLNNAEELNELFMRNKDLNMLLNEKDRETLHDLINKLSKDNCSKLLQTFLSLQVIHTFLYYCKIFNIIISGK